MIQLNLLPDVKLKYIKAQRSRRMVFAVSILACVASVALLALLYSVNLLQKKHISDLTKDISSDSRTLQKKPQINKILTVQNQLGSLTSLHDTKPVAGRLFEYLNSVTPSNVSITNLHFDFTLQAATITGTSDTLASVNKYIDTLKFTTYKAPGDTKGSKAFNNVVLTSFGVSSNSQNPSQAANYTITISYDPTIFDVTKTITLSVPSITTTRSTLDKPTDLFQAAPANTNKTGGQ